MAKNHLKQPNANRRLLILYGVLLTIGGALLVAGLVLALRDGDPSLVGFGVLAVLIPGSAFPIAVMMFRRQRFQAEQARRPQESVAYLRQIGQALALTETQKTLVFRDEQHRALADAIDRHLQQEEFESADAVAEAAARLTGSDTLSRRVRVAQAERSEKAVAEADARLSGMLIDYAWDEAAAEVSLLEQTFDVSSAVADMRRRIETARHDHKQELERRFLETAARDDVEKAMELIKELDQYLSEGEVEPLREVARGVIKEKRENLGVQFKIAVHDKEWTEAIRIGREIVASFPNTKMAEEVRQMEEQLEARAAETEAG